MFRLMVYLVIGFWIYNQMQTISMMDIQHLIETYFNGAIESMKKILGV